MGLLRVSEAKVRSWDLVNLLYHKENNLDQVLDNLHVIFAKLNAISVLLELESNESALKFFIRSVLTADDVLRVRVGSFGLLEAFVELNVLVDRAGD